jgi:V8-like Glu-specific endopeptidase
MFLITLLLSLIVSVSPVQKAHDATRHTAQRTSLMRDMCSATVVGPYALLTATHCELPDDALAIQEGDVLTHILGRIRDGADHTIYLVADKFDTAAEINQHDALSQGEDVFVFGNPGDWHDIYRRGYVAGLIDNEIAFELPVYHGDSGAGIFNSQGQLVGVLTGVEGQKSDDGQSIGLAFSFKLQFTDTQLEQAKSFVPNK